MMNTPDAVPYPTRELGVAAGVADRGNMTIVRAAASADHRKARQPLAQRAVFGGELTWIAGVEIGALVQLRMASLRRVGA